MQDKHPGVFRGGGFLEHPPRYVQALGISSPRHSSVRAPLQLPHLGRFLVSFCSDFGLQYRLSPVVTCRGSGFRGEPTSFNSRLLVGTVGKNRSSWVFGEVVCRWCHLVHCLTSDFRYARGCDNVSGPRFRWKILPGPDRPN